MIRTFQYRVKDSCTRKHLDAHARAVNFVWNFCNDTQKHALKWRKKWLSGFDLSNLCAGSSRDLPVGAVVKTGPFSCDSQGRWFINITAALPDRHTLLAPKELGIDLGLKDFASFSDRPPIASQQFYRDQQSALGLSQRARKKQRTQAIHQRITNRRKDFLHKLSTRLVHDHGFIAVGNVNASKLTQTKMAKSVLDAGWSSFRDMLRYKAIAHGAIVTEVNEAFSTVTCSCCLDRTGPKGVAGLRIRAWTCSTCNAVHDRDTNAARNILRLGHQTLAVGIPTL